MTTVQLWVLWTYAAIIAIWPIRHAVLWFVFRKIDILTPDSPRFDHPHPPLITAIIPAKDEENTLGDCLASVCSQTYPHLEILVIDDRSTDRTGAIARERAAVDPGATSRSWTCPRGGRGKRTPFKEPPTLHGASGSGSSTPIPVTSPKPRHRHGVRPFPRGFPGEPPPEMRMQTWENVVQPFTVTS